jgi:hypothetical protein
LHDEVRILIFDDPAEHFRSRNVRSWSDPVVVPSDPRGHAARAMHEIFPENYEIPRAAAARV